MLPILFKNEYITIYTYFLSYALSLSLSIIIGVIRAKKEGRDINLILNACIFMIIGVLIGARLFFVILSPEHKETIGIVRWFFFWEGGQVFYGGLAGGIISVWLYTVVARAGFISLLDFMAPYSMLGYGLHRITGCLFAGCCYGRPTEMPWGISYPVIARASEEYGYGIRLHPVQVYEGLLGFLLFFILERYRRNNPETGKVSLWYLILYSSGRFITEFFRGDSIRGFIIKFSSNPYWQGISTSQGVSIMILSVIGLYCLIKKLSKRDAVL